MTGLQDSVTIVVPARQVGRVLSEPLFTLGGTPVSAVTLGVFLAVLILTWFASKLAQRGMRRALLIRRKADTATVGIATRLVHYGILLIGLGIALDTVGINVAALFTAGAFFAVALGFAMQNVAENFVSGVILMTERTIKPGDILQVETTVVRVTHIGMRATVVRSRDEEDLIIPNSVLVKNTVTNYTLRDSVIRIRALVGVSYRSDVELVIRVLTETATALPSRLEEFEPVVLLTGFGDSSINFEVSAWTADPWSSRRALSQLNESIWWALKKNGITIPFPQRDVHVYAEDVLKDTVQSRRDMRGA